MSRNIKTFLFIIILSFNINMHLVASGIRILDANTTFTTNEDIVLETAFSFFDSFLGIEADNVTIINNHLIKIKSNSSSYWGIYSRTDLKNINILNNNTIDIKDNHGSGAFSSFSAIETRGLDNSSITNAGTIRVESNGVHRFAYGIYISGFMKNSSITNPGNIIVKSQYGASGIFVYDLNNSKIINSGTITSDAGISINEFRNSTILNSGVISSSHTGIYIKPHTSTSNAGNIINSGTITGVYSIYARFKGKIINEESGILNGQISAVYDDLFFTNKGTINIPSSPTNISKITNYTQLATGILEVELNIDNNGDGTHSTLQVINKAILADGTNIKVDVHSTDQATQKFLKKDSIITGIVFSDNAIEVDTTKLNIKDNSILLNFEASLSNTDKSLDLKAVEDSTIYEAINKVGRKKSLGGVAKVLDNIDNKLKNNEMRKFNSHLNTLSTNEAVAKALTQVTPANSISTQSITNQITNTMSSVIGARQSSQRSLSSGDIAFSDKNVWIKPFGGYTSQDDKDGISGFSANTFGLGFGVDGEYKSGYRAGLALFYTNADVDTNHVDQSSDIDVFNLVAYGSNPIIDDKTNLFYQIGFGLQKTNSSRVISGVGTAKADYTSKNLFLELKVSRNIEINKSFLVKPAFITSYAYYKNPSYSENGAGGINLDVEKFSAKSFVLGLESEFIYNLDQNSQLLANVVLSYDFYNDAQSINSSFQGGGTVFSTQGIKNDALIYKVGVGFMRKLQDNLFIDFKYDFDGRGSEFKNHVISSKINYKF